MSMKNDDLISRAALGISRCNPDVFSNRAYGEGWNACIAMIEAAPAVDAAPVVHARWIQYEPDLHGTKPLECGACHYLFARLYPRDFCPHCGAKMDGDDNG